MTHPAADPLPSEPQDGSAAEAPSASANAAGASSPEASPAVPPLPAEAPLVERDVLVEDVSIDGMCGVY